MSSSVEQIKDRLNITDVVGSYITLEKSGRNLRARCPFHNERTPSFFVSPERGTYHCFGCDAGGDIFEFVETFEGVDFYGALKILAAKAGVELARENPRIRDEKERLYHILDEAASFYEKALAGSPYAMQYLTERGLADSTRKEWRIGFAPDAWQDIFSFFSSRGIGGDALGKAGLVIRSAGGRYYDRFRRRIMFPIADSSGRVIAFSARLLPGTDGIQKAKTVSVGGFNEAKPASAQRFSEAKYINSPETELYRKSSALYGLDKAKRAIREKGACVIVEGQMDVLMAHQAGIRNAVATSGTALTDEHISRIRRFTEKIVFAFDADSAGFSATERGLALALKEGMEVSLAHLPPQTDPAELGAASPDDLSKRIENAPHAVDFFLTVLKETITDKRRRAVEIGKKVLPLIAHMKNRIEQAHFIGETAREMGIREEALWEEMRAIRATTNTSGGIFSARNARAPRPRSETITERLVGVLLWQKKAKNNTADFFKNAECEVEKICGVSFREVAERFSPRARERMMFDAERSYEGRVLREDDITELVRNLRESVIRARLRGAIEALANAENARDEAKAERISKEINILRKSI